MSKFRTVVAAAAILAIAATGCRPTVTDTAGQACLAQTPVVVKSGTFTSQWRTSALADNTVADLRDADWVTAAAYPVMLDGFTTGVCTVGGHITNTNDFTTTPWSTWHGITGFLTRHPSIDVVGLSVDNVGDGISLAHSAGLFKITGARMTRIHDDCIQDDGMRGGVIEDSFLECYSGVSARGYSGYVYDGHAETLSVKNSLMWAKAMPNTWRTTTPGHIGWFKFSQSVANEGTPPLLNLENVTLRVDVPATTPMTLDLPPRYPDPTHPGTLLSWPMTCSNVTIVWTGTGAYPGTVPSCATVTTDVSVWNNAVTAYNTDHPDTL